ncbi:MAG: PAS domain-containing protein [Candidatus Omnitrophica bacterium]|nr:PAS domain-containing protein [Candidatus Omnitrophota bacterium]
MIRKAQVNKKNTFKSQKSLKDMTARLNRAQAVAHIGSWHIDIINNTLVWSDETYRIFGLDIGLPLHYEKFLEIVHPDDREYVFKSWQAALLKGPYDIEHRIIVGGKVKWVREKGQVEFNKNGKAQSGIGTVQDITEYKQQQADIIRLQRELLHVSRVTTMGELTAALAHELNQPLTAIMSNAQAARRFLEKKKPDLNEIRKIFTDIIKDDKRASEVIGRLRALLRKSNLDLKTLNINDVIREVISLVHSEIVVKDISLTTELCEEMALVRGDRIQLQQVVLNLILNSLEAIKSRDSKILRIQTQQKNDKCVIVRVEDNGVGIDDENMLRLFDPFFTTKKEGLGMGLSINKTIIEAHGGRLWAKNNSKGGATFSFSLPLVKEYSK